MDQFALLLESYNRQIESLNVPNNSSSVAQTNVIDILLTRDRIDKILQDSTDTSSDLIIQLMNLDDELAGKKDVVANFFQLVNQYKEKNNFPNQNKWWWNLDEAALKSHPLNRYDWFFNLAKLGLWTFDVALLVTLINKILLGSSGLAGAGAIAVSTFLPILQARSVLTPAGQKQFNSLLSKLGINRNWTEEIQFVITLVITLFLWMLSANLPKILAQFAYNEGEKMLYDITKTKEVEKAFKRAIELNPNIKTNVAKAYFNEGKKKFDEGVKKVQQNDWEEAEKLFTRAIELEPNMDIEPADLSPKPFCFSTRKNIKEAVACFTTLEGIREADQKNWEKAERLFKKAIELDANQTRAYDELGTVYEELQQLDDAEKYYSIAVRKGDYSPSFYRLARLYLLKSSQINKNHDQDFIDVKRTILTLKAISFSEKGIDAINENKEDYNEVVQLQLKFVAYRNLGWAYLLLDDNEKANEFLRLSLAMIRQLKQKDILQGGSHIINSLKGYASVYCLLAQLDDKQKNNSDNNWKECKIIIENKKSEDYLPEEYLWKLRAEKHFKK